MIKQRLECDQCGLAQTNPPAFLITANVFTPFGGEELLHWCSKDCAKAWIDNYQIPKPPSNVVSDVTKEVFEAKPM